MRPLVTIAEKLPFYPQGAVCQFQGERGRLWLRGEWHLGLLAEQHGDSDLTMGLAAARGSCGRVNPLDCGPSGGTNELPKPISLVLPYGKFLKELI